MRFAAARQNLLILACWQGAAMAAASPLLPTPGAVLEALWTEASHGRLLLDLGATIARVSLCFLLAMGLGGGAGIAMASSARLNRWLDPWLQLVMGVPAMVVAILAYIWMGLGEAAAITAVTLCKLPSMAVILREGARARDPELAEMARVFQFSARSRMMDLLLPELAPYLLAASRTGLALVWKSVLLVELLGRSSGIGFQLGTYFQMLDITHILAYAASFMAVMAMIEATLLTWMDRRVARWKR